MGKQSLQSSDKHSISASKKVLAELHVLASFLSHAMLEKSQDGASITGSHINMTQYQACLREPDHSASGTSGHSITSNQVMARR